MKAHSESLRSSSASRIYGTSAPLAFRSASRRACRGCRQLLSRSCQIWRRPSSLPEEDTVEDTESALAGFSLRTKTRRRFGWRQFETSPWRWTPRTGWWFVSELGCALARLAISGTGRVRFQTHRSVSEQDQRFGSPCSGLFLFQGYYLARPSEFQGRPSSKPTLLRTSWFGLRDRLLLTCVLARPNPHISSQSGCCTPFSLLSQPLTTDFRCSSCRRPKKTLLVIRASSKAVRRIKTYQELRFARERFEVWMLEACCCSRPLDQQAHPNCFPVSAVSEGLQ